MCKGSTNFIRFFKVVQNPSKVKDPRTSWSVKMLSKSNIQRTHKMFIRCVLGVSHCASTLRDVSTL